MKFERRDKTKEKVELDDNYYAIAKLLQELIKVMRGKR